MPELPEAKSGPSTSAASRVRTPKCSLFPSEKNIDFFLSTEKQVKQLKTKWQKERETVDVKKQQRKQE